MTVGSWDKGNTPNLPTTGNQLYWKRSWSGADRVVLREPKPYKLYETWVSVPTKSGRRRNVKRVLRIPDWDGPTGTWKPPKRAYDVPHAYSMSETRAKEIFFYVRKRTCSGVPAPNQKPSSFSQGPYPFFANCGTNTWVAASLLTANDQIDLVNKLGEKVTGSAFNMAVSAAEGLESIGMITGAAIRLAKAAHHARRGDFAGASKSLVQGTDRRPLKGSRDMSHASKRVATDLSSNWLELQYGWLPLLSDIHAGAKMLAHQLNVPQRRTYRAVVRRESVLTRYFSRSEPATCNPITYGTLDGTSKSTRTHLRAITAYISEHPSIPQLLGLTDPLSVAWEKLPFSFVADWFLPVGDYLEARGNASKLVGTFVTSDLRTGTRHIPDTSDYDVLLVGEPEAWESCLFSRTISSSLSVPPPEFVPLSEATSWRRMMNAGALLVQAFAGR